MYGSKLLFYVIWGIKLIWAQPIEKEEVKIKSYLVMVNYIYYVVYNWVLYEPKCSYYSILHIHMFHLYYLKSSIRLIKQPNLN